MSNIRIGHMTLGIYQTNCYFVYRENSDKVLVFDPADHGEKIEEALGQHGLHTAAILLTHGHFDHAGAAEELADKYQISIYAHEAERETLEDPGLNLCGMIGEHKVYRADIFVKDEEVLNLAGFSIRVFFTPGHTIGGCCYYIADEKILFSGDTLFQESVGRTDFPRGSASDLIRAIREKLMPLPDDVTVYTGHDESTLIGYERMHNPYL